MQKMNRSELKEFLDEKADLYNSPKFLESDPIGIPHRFTKKEDVEISAFLAATIAWGQRVTIINNANKMMAIMDESPHEFILNFTPKDLKRFEGFVHRTFNFEDVCYFMHALRNIYLNHGGLENAMCKLGAVDGNSCATLAHFKTIFFSLPDYPNRTRKHVGDPSTGSTAKRLNMYLRWMVRKDNRGVDFGIWDEFSPAHLSLPLDVHTGNISRKLGLLKRTQNDWRAVCEVDKTLRKFCPEDPIKYDFALFGLGAFEDF